MHTQTHTPGPWTVHGNIGRKSQTGIVADSAPCIIAIMGNQRQWPQAAQDNAAFIVRACNAHDELVAALKSLILQEDWQGEDVAPESPIGKARAALAKAQEGEV